MKNRLAFMTLQSFTMALILFLFSGCETEEINPQLPLLTTQTVTNITQISATTGGVITSDGESDISARGVCWGTAASPTISGNKTSDGSGSGSYSSTISGLASNTTYYVRAYATNAKGTAYGDELTFKTLQNTSPNVSDIDGNIYPTVVIGTQIWMAKNLMVTKFNDGTPIPLVTDNIAWGQLTSPGYCYYDNDEDSLGVIYGALYTWYTVDEGLLCPTGWHVPSDLEWTVLSDFLGGNASAGGKLKESGTAHWKSTSSSATNETGFTALPGGFRETYGTFSYLESYGGWWSSTDSYSYVPWSRYMLATPHTLTRMGYIKHTGMSVRCLKD